MKWNEIKIKQFYREAKVIPAYRRIHTLLMREREREGGEGRGVGGRGGRLRCRQPIFEWTSSRNMTNSSTLHFPLCKLNRSVNSIVSEIQSCMALCNIGHFNPLPLFYFPFSLISRASVWYLVICFCNEQTVFLFALLLFVFTLLCLQCHIFFSIILLCSVCFYL